jgi:GNAT superfamily N-acetyltransferase
MRDGVAAASCDLRVLDVDGVRMAQVEDVLTLESFRGKGFARAVVSHAVAAAQRVGAEVIWLEAERDDWPRELYSRMGFVVHGPEVTVATRMP